MKGQYKSGKPQSSGFKGKYPSKQAHKDKTMTKTIPLALDRYKSASDPLRRAMGLHGSMPISPMMAAKYTSHPDPAVANAAKKVSAKLRSDRQGSMPGGRVV